ncbi:phospholipase A [Dysgonomonas sp. 520]|uniref:phospholipase A n=1 Tax=Dysgonomonas sp. 520 TaxID=2302931 RepID=UPI0013D17EAF|nr:phospholipase A [Dysgonomonas sp. 520]NDW10559.1 phospholipase [Dysgonomonas sp. 520]
MNKFTLFILFLISPLFCSAQEGLQYIDNDSLRTLYEQAMKDPNIFKPKYLEISEEEAVKFVDKQPAFAVYKDTYFVTGIPLDREITNKTADASFQISIRQRLTKSVLPFNTFLYLTYTQKSFWDVYDESSPFRDTNYNPGLGLGKALFYKGRAIGGIFAQIKHESNGRGGDESRSWNYLSFSSKYFLNPHFNIFGEFWIPYVDGSNNKNLLDYKGLANIGINFISDKHRWWVSAEFNPRKGVGNINTVTTIGFKISESANQYLFARLNNGYGESLLDYDKYSMNFRVGICIKPDFYSIY